MIDDDDVVSYMSVINPYDVMCDRSRFTHDDKYVYVTYLLDRKDLNIQKEIMLRYLELLREYIKLKVLYVHYDNLIVKHMVLDNSEYQIFLGFKLVEWGNENSKR